MSEEILELESSELGTIEYWDKAYEKELKNFIEFGDEGEIWFGNLSVRRVVNWIKKSNLNKSSKIIDLGCGNGYTCCELAKEGFTNLVGIDYSENAIRLAKQVSERDGYKIKYSVVDILTQKPNEKFDICIDKGTYDAISLSPDDAKSKRIAYKKYLFALMKPSSIFIITSCNWTSYELKNFFLEEQMLDVLDEIHAQNNFSYGGKVGSTTSTVIFKMK